MPYWFAGELYQQERSIPLAPVDPALVYGASVFTTMRIYEKSLDHPLTAWRQHCDRITHSLQAFGWLQPNWERLTQGCHTLITTYPVLRITILANGQELITGRPLPQNLEQQQQTGVTVWVAQGLKYQRSLPEHKTSNYLPCWLAMQAANDHGARDAILTTPSGEWLETSTGNLWGYKAGQWWTPPLSSGLLPGISRTRLLQNLTNQALTQTPWTLNLVKQFECLAYSNCVVGIMPIHTVLLGNIKLNYSSTNEGLSILKHMFSRPSIYQYSN